MKKSVILVCMSALILSACSNDKTAFFDSSVVPGEKYTKPTKSGRTVKMGETPQVVEKEKEFGPSFDFDKLR